LKKLPNEFQAKIIGTFGEDGTSWLEHFPEIIIEYTQRWSLILRPHFEPLSYNFVAPVTRQDGSEALLKLGVPNPELTSEIAALRIFNGRGAAHLLKADAGGGAMLLEFVKPGTPLLEVTDDKKATEIAALTMLQLWRPISDTEDLVKQFEPVKGQSTQDFVTIERWASGIQRLRKKYNDGTGHFPKHLIEQAETLFAELIASSDHKVVLHGDLHHWNILAAQRQPWLAIDPKGVVGDPSFDVAAWMKNPIGSLPHWPNLKSVLARRLDQFKEILEFDRERLLKWSLAQSVLSAWWCVESNTDCMDEDLHIAHVLSSLLNG